jgi:NAD(P)-dependent dehydrogenase (short-subunit alcohol dehydrogenase family)
VTGAPPPVALVTGGLHRVGAAISVALADAGYALALHRRSDGEADASLADALVRNGTEHHILSADLAAATGPGELFDAVIEVFGRTPALIVNNASLFEESMLATLDRPALDAALAVNLAAPVMLTQRLLAAGGGGAVVNILDQRVRNPVPDQIAYSIAKQGLWQATRTLARAAAPHVRVNAVAPGLTLPTDDYEAGRMERMAGRMPLHRLATPQHIADAVLYLARADAVTGQTIFVDSGANLTGFERDFAWL